MAEQNLTPPVPKKVEHRREHHGDVFIDPYEWLRDKESEEVLNYLKAEAEYTEAVTADQQPLRESIFNEIKDRTLLSDLTVPNRIGDWWYYSRMVPGGQYPVFYRYPALHEGDEVVRYTPPTVTPGEVLEGEVVILDCNEYAQDMEFFSLGSFQPARNGKLLSISVDEKGDERYEQRFLNMETGTFLEDTIPNIAAGSFFINHAEQLIYLVPDESWRPWRVYVHDVGQDTEDHLIYEEPDNTMWLGAAMSSDRSSVVITSSNSEYTEVRLIPTREPKGEPTLLIPKSAGIEYYAEPLNIAGTLLLRRETPVLGGYNREDYRAYRDWAPAADGTLIPISVIHRADLDMSKPHPVIQYGYGSYESSMDPMFSIPMLSILDRGVIYVIAHIRGGGEMGRSWYQNGKKLAKKNTFTDFVDVTSYIAAKPWADEARIGCYGGSAGGLLMGAVLNLAPEKYAACLAAVPFVDALTTILDPELPLSAMEWEEWGNPIEDPEVYAYMKSYTPYENIRPVRYPAIAAVTSLHDTRVLYVEPAKWIAALREQIDPSSPVPLLKIDMSGGHGGGSGRYTRWREIAWDYAFLLSNLGVTE